MKESCAQLLQGGKVGKAGKAGRAEGLAGLIKARGRLNGRPREESPKKITDYYGYGYGSATQRTLPPRAFRSDSTYCKSEAAYNLLAYEALPPTACHTSNLSPAYA